jgi:MFS family permease
MANVKKETWATHFESLPIWNRFWNDRWTSGHGGLFAGIPSEAYIAARADAIQIYGYQTSASPTGWNIATERQQLISSLMTLGAFISSGTAGLVANKFGRRACLWVACLTCCVANIIMMTTTHIGALYVGRLVIGFANGYFMTFSQLYIQESKLYAAPHF